MIEQGFHIGNRKWWVMVYYDVRKEGEFSRVADALLSAGAMKYMVDDAIANLRGWNRGYTFSNFNDRVSVMVFGKAEDAGQMFDTIVHEMKHLAEHVGEYYDVDPRDELSAYLQGEVGRNMWPAAAMVLCPNCH